MFSFLKLNVALTYVEYNNERNYLDSKMYYTQEVSRRSFLHVQ